MLGLIGGIFLALTAVGLVFYGAQKIAVSWLIALTFWTALSLGALLLVLIHHIFDASWSTVIRRTLEHWLAVFPWLGLLFLPLVVGSWMQRDLLWKWMDPLFDLGQVGGHGTVGADILWVKKSAFLNLPTFTVATVLFFACWIWLSHRLRKHSFEQDEDGSLEHTYANRRTAAFGIPLTAVSLTFAAFYWLMSLEYHWFSTMYGVWFFSGAMRSALAFVTLLSILLLNRGVLRGIFSTAHMLNLGNLMLAFTVFWAYITFSQYFLIWNANIPEETFWYNVRETGGWMWVGMILIFGHFLVPFLFLLQHPLKKRVWSMSFICLWILAIQLLDILYNIVPAKKLPNGDPMPFGISPFDVTALLAVGGICGWAFFRSFGRARCIPIRDPRIIESLHIHE